MTFEQFVRPSVARGRRPGYSFSGSRSRTPPRLANAFTTMTNLVRAGSIRGGLNSAPNRVDGVEGVRV